MYFAFLLEAWLRGVIRLFPLVFDEDKLLAAVNLSRGRILVFYCLLFTRSLSHNRFVAQKRAAFDRLLKKVVVGSLTSVVMVLFVRYGLVPHFEATLKFII